MLFSFEVLKLGLLAGNEEAEAQLLLRGVEGGSMDGDGASVHEPPNAQDPQVEP